jgi:copper chaperone CopZ
MQALIVLALLVPAAALAAPGAKKPGANEPSPQTRTFYIDRVRTPADVKAITDAVMKVKSVTKVDALTPDSGYANISFDHHAVTHQQIAQAIANAGDSQASFRFTVSGYADNAAKIDAIFARVKDQVEIQTINKYTGEFVLRFLPLKAGKPGPHGVGFNRGKNGHPIMDPPPAGLSLKIRAVPPKKPKRA